MTTINAAAAMLVGMRSKIAALIVLAAGGLAGCTSGSGDLLSGANSPLATNTGMSAPASQTRAKIAIAPVIGAPDSIAKQIVAQLTTELGSKNVARIECSRRPSRLYASRLHCCSTRSDRHQSFLHLGRNETNRRTSSPHHRRRGREGAGAGDPWASVSPQLIQVVAAKTSGQLDTWLPQKAPAPAASIPVAASASGQGQSELASASTAPVTRSGLQMCTCCAGGVQYNHQQHRPSRCRNRTRSKRRWRAWRWLNVTCRSAPQ